MTISKHGVFHERIMHLEDPIASYENIQKTVRDLSETKESLKIYAGEAYWAIFDHPEMLRALRKLGKNGVIIQVVVGPILSRGGSLESPEITILAEEGIIEFYYRSKRGLFPDFFIVDDRVVLAEKEKHNIIPRLHLREIVKIYKHNSPEEFCRYADEYSSATRKVNFMKNPRKKCLVLRSFEIRGVLKFSNQLGKDYDSLTKVEIKKIVRALHAHEALIEKRFNEATSASRSKI